jgi:hypothetical protein
MREKKGNDGLLKRLQPLEEKKRNDGTSFIDDSHCMHSHLCELYSYRDSLVGVYTEEEIPKIY